MEFLPCSADGMENARVQVTSALRSLAFELSVIGLTSFGCSKSAEKEYNVLSAFIERTIGVSDVVIRLEDLAAEWLGDFLDRHGERGKELVSQDNLESRMRHGFESLNEKSYEQEKFKVQKEEPPLEQEIKTEVNNNLIFDPDDGDQKSETETVKNTLDETVLDEQEKELKEFYEEKLVHTTTNNKVVDNKKSADEKIITEEQANHLMDNAKKEYPQWTNLQLSERNLKEDKIKTQDALSIYKTQEPEIDLDLSDNGSRNQSEHKSDEAGASALPQVKSPIEREIEELLIITEERRRHVEEFLKESRGDAEKKNGARPKTKCTRHCNLCGIADVEYGEPCPNKQNHYLYRRLDALLNIPNPSNKYRTRQDSRTPVFGNRSTERRASASDRKGNFSWIDQRPASENSYRKPENFDYKSPSLAGSENFKLDDYRSANESISSSLVIDDDLPSQSVISGAQSIKSEDLSGSVHGSITSNKKKSNLYEEIDEW